MLVPPWSVAKPEKSSVFEASLYVGVPSKAHVLAAFSPVSVPPLPVSVAIPSKPAEMSDSLPAKPSPSDPVSVTASIWSPCSVSLPPSPSTAPVNAASMSNVSAPAPPFRSKVEPVVTLN